MIGDCYYYRRKPPGRLSLSALFFPFITISAVLILNMLFKRGRLVGLSYCRLTSLEKYSINKKQKIRLPPWILLTIGGGIWSGSGKDYQLM